MKASTESKDTWLTFHKWETTLNKDRHLLMNVTLHLPLSKVCWQFAKKIIHWQKKLIRRIVYMSLKTSVWLAGICFTLILCKCGTQKWWPQQMHCNQHFCIQQQKIVLLKGDAWLYLRLSASQNASNSFESHFNCGQGIIECSQQSQSIWKMLNYVNVGFVGMLRSLNKKSWKCKKND